ncbi:uncharacterized protein KD926_004631 [Aspergillus affinis]|uniref:uncharacterized protein n=1 Tax=Aspergillus affinis TaxID=1070780 RepID=UPI0022FDE6FE|nr:uncharacterized protein KD926_004631 [Aspergillus affinis]KAI9043127.1 hypothetical protein KD926_004631 [Aspergillus affinis]
MLNKHTTSAIDGLSPSGGIPDSLHPPGFSLAILYPGSAPGALSQPTSQHIDGAICRVKYHLYEVSIYWPVIYSIIINGSADPELLPYAPLFFQSATSLLGSASLALRFWEQIEASLDALQGPSMLSPAVQYMQESLKVRLEETKIQQRA